MTASLTTHARRFGTGSRSALAIHCSLGHAGAWRGVGAALGDLLTLTAYDLPSHGKSGDWDGTSDLHSLCTEMARPFMAEPVDLIGHSFGATVALRLAVEQPEKVRTLTLIEPVYFAAAAADAPQALVAHNEASRAFTEPMDRQDWPEAARAFNRLWGDGRRWDDLPEGARRYMSERMHFIAGQSPMIFGDNARLLDPGRMARASMPVLLLQGSHAPAIIDAVQKALAHRLPMARRATIEGAGHMSPVTHPEEVARAIRSLIEIG